MGFRGAAPTQFMASWSGLYVSHTCAWLVLMRLLLQATTRKTRILDVVYNSSNNELVSVSFACLSFALFEKQANVSFFYCFI